MGLILEQRTLESKSLKQGSLIAVYAGKKYCLARK
jgi:hypothetical protein